MRPLTAALAALLVATAATTVLVAAPAVAAPCAAGAGVTVVVGDTITCDPDGGESAAESFKDAGHTLTYVDSQPGFVCQVDGAPSTSCARTPPSNAYWGLFWSDGTSGSWKYSAVAASALAVPDGGWVAFVFQQSSDKTLPSVQPLAGSVSAPPAAAVPAVSRKTSDSGSLGVVAGGVGVLLIAGIGVAMWRRTRAGQSS